MKCFLTRCFAGFFAFDKHYNILDYELFPSDKLVERLVEMDAGQLTREEKLLIERLEDYEPIIIETDLNQSLYREWEKDLNLEWITPHPAGQYLRENLANVLLKIGFIDAIEDLPLILHNINLRLVEEKLKEASQSEDMLLIQAINALDELDESAVKLVERLREWYSIHFPELDKIRNHETYAQLIAEYGDREIILKLEDTKNFKFEKSLGKNLNPYDLAIIKEFANSIKFLQDTRKSMNIYVEDKMEEIAPNLKDLTGALLGAKLIAHVGGLKKLAMLPSSTVQVLGAEKALFRHLKTGDRPPKHGLIYQHPVIRGSKWWIKGKLSRTLASKISLAVRKDFFSGEYDANIKKSFLERVDDIKKQYPFPPRTRKSKKRIRKKKKKNKYRFKREDYLL